jgi:hypothetical protein
VLTPKTLGVHVALDVTATDNGLQAKLREFAHDGFATLPLVFSGAEIDLLTAELTDALAKPDDSVLRHGDVVYAARNLMQVWPRAKTIWRTPVVVKFLQHVMGKRFGLVRVLFFDKPPAQTWSLPWHKDLTIAVRDNRLHSTRFCHPTTKAGVPHIEAPQDLLENMVTVRIHLDDVSMTNGPIRVQPGSHLTGKLASFDESGGQTMVARRGDVLCIRPLVAHCSLPSAKDTQEHRRILHLEFAGTPTLADGYEWHDYIRSEAT